MCVCVHAIIMCEFVRKKNLMNQSMIIYVRRKKMAFLWIHNNNNNVYIAIIINIIIIIKNGQSMLQCNKTMIMMFNVCSFIIIIVICRQHTHTHTNILLFLVDKTKQSSLHKTRPKKKNDDNCY